jgi:hypothetical protein
MVTAHRAGVHHMVPSSVDVKDAEGNTQVTTYAVRRPDGNWSNMLVNRDEDNSHSECMVFDGPLKPEE